MIFYISHMNDLYGGLFNPDFLFGYYYTAKFLTYSALVLEVVCPILLWFNKTRKPALISIVLFHIGMALAMNLNCFQYIMIVGWLSFLIQPDEDTPNSRERLLTRLRLVSEEKARLEQQISILKN